MADLFDNPMGLTGFEFVEFASPVPGLLEPIFERMGFTLVARHRSKDVVLYRQGGGQIEEYLMKFNGEGIQHIALICDDLLATVDSLALAGVPLMTAPSNSYYDMLSGRLPEHGQNVAKLQSRGILMDGSTEGGTPRLLLQIFSQTQLGPVFFEFIQRKGDEGFGEGNFKALFESLERDQIQRGALDVKA